MAVRVGHDEGDRVAVLYCSTSGTAFGPVFTGSGADLDAEDFLQWLIADGADWAETRGGMVPTGGWDSAHDPRAWSSHDLHTLHQQWENQREATYQQQAEAKAKGF